MTIILRLIGIAAALLIIVFVFAMIRKRKLSDEFATMWIIASLLFLAGAIFSKQIFSIYQHIKGATGSGLGILLFLAIILIMFLLIIITSKLSVRQEQLKNMVQKIALLEREVKKIAEDKTTSSGDRNTGKSD
jgi:hypothetical protein